MNHVRSIDAGGIRRCFCTYSDLMGAVKKAVLQRRAIASEALLPVKRQSALAGSSTLHFRSIFIHHHFWCCLWLKKQGSAFWDHSHLSQLSQYWYESFICKLTLYSFKGMVLIVLDQRVTYWVTHWLLGLSALWLKCSSLSLGAIHFMRVGGPSSRIPASAFSCKVKSGTCASTSHSFTL